MNVQLFRTARYLAHFSCCRRESFSVVVSWTNFQVSIYWIIAPKRVDENILQYTFEVITGELFVLGRIQPW